MRAALLVMTAWLLQAVQVTACADDAPERPAGSNLTHLLEAELSRWPARTGLYVKHLGTGEQAGVRAQEHFESASTIKVPIMVLAYRLADQKQLDLDARYEIEAADYRGGSGVFKYADVGSRPTLRDVITQMIITSDNTATDIMIAQVGGRERLNQFLRQSGFAALRLNGTTYEFFRLGFEALDPKYRSLTPQQVFALTTDRPAFTEPYRELIAQVKQASARARMKEGSADLQNTDQARWFGVAAPAEMAAVLEGIERCTLTRRESCDEMKRILRAQQVRHKIPHYLSVPVGNKTGDTGSVTNDVAIVQAHSGPVVIASYNMDVRGQRTELDDRIGELARRIVGYFDGAR